MHDENVRLLKEYEGARAHFVSVKFRRKREATAFHRLRTEGVDGLQLLRSMNYPNELRRVILNQVTMALASDCLHHLYEALRCLENPSGLYGLFQHAVHLVTFERLELQTAPENFNFVFKSHADDDLYELLYGFLPLLLLYLSTVTLELFDRIKPMDGAAKRAFLWRSRYGFYLTEDDRRAEIVVRTLDDTLRDHATCGRCSHPVVVTRHNAARILLTDSFRCTACRCNNPFPFSWAF